MIPEGEVRVSKEGRKRQGEGKGKGHRYFLNRGVCHYRCLYGIVFVKRNLMHFFQDFNFFCC